jgi:hypothetical protein
MRVLTIRQEFIERFLNGTKTTEIRSWRTLYRGELFLHCSAKNASPDMAGCIIASCTLSNIIWNDEKKMYEWVFEDVKPLPDRIRVKGKLGVWFQPS